MEELIKQNFSRFSNITKTSKDILHPNIFTIATENKIDYFFSAKESSDTVIL